MPAPLLRSRRQGFLPLPRDAGGAPPAELRGPPLLRARRPFNPPPPPGRALLLRPHSDGTGTPIEFRAGPPPLVGRRRQDPPPRPGTTKLGRPRGASPVLPSIPPRLRWGRSPQPPPFMLRGRARLLLRPGVVAVGDFRWIDFEVPAWGEFTAGPTTSGSGAALAQSSAAAFPDRPGTTGAKGLLVTLTAGTGQSYLAHDLGAGVDELFARVLLAPATATGGAAPILMGRTSGGAEAWRLTFDTAARTATLLLSTGQSVSAMLPAGVTWHTLEVRVNDGGRQGDLWADGIRAGSIAASAAMGTTRTVRIGVPAAKDNGLTGTLWLDELKLGNAYRGPVVLPAAAAMTAGYDWPHAGGWNDAPFS